MGRLSRRERALLLDLKKAGKFFGVSIDVKNIISCNEKYMELVISFDSDRFEIFKNMSCGRFPVPIKRQFTVFEVRERIRQYTAAVVAKDLGISRATLFRRIKSAEDTGRFFL